MKHILEYLLSKSKKKTKPSHEVVTIENVYNYENKCEYEIRLNELYEMMIKDAKNDYNGAKEYTVRENNKLENIVETKLTIEGCILLAIRCVVEGQNLTYTGNSDIWWEDVVKKYADMIFEIFENFWDDIVKIIKKGGNSYPTYYIIFPNNEVISTFCYSLKGLKTYKVK